MQTISAILALGPVVPVLTIDDVETAVPLARALAKGGLPAIEVTLRTAASPDAIRAIAAEVPEATVGAGTILTPKHYEAAVDAGATGWQVLTNVIIPLSKPGIAIGSIFVVTLVMGDFITVRLMSGGQSASVGLMMANQISLLQYPAAAANAVVLLLVVLMMVALMLRVVDIRKEL